MQEPVESSAQEYAPPSPAGQRMIRVVGPAEDAVDVTSTPSRSNLARGAMWGATAGFLFGLLPLLASTLMAAVAGMAIAKAMELRLEKGSPPRIHFVKS